jgi:hypothetical protein
VTGFSGVQLRVFFKIPPQFNPCTDKKIVYRLYYPILGVDV